MRRKREEILHIDARQDGDEGADARRKRLKVCDLCERVGAELLVHQRKLPITQDGVSLRLQLARERPVDLAALDEQRHVRLRVPLDVGGDLEERRVRDGGGLDDAVEGEVKDVAGYGGACQREGMGDGMGAHRRSSNRRRRRS